MSTRFCRLFFINISLRVICRIIIKQNNLSMAWFEEENDFFCRKKWLQNMIDYFLERNNDDGFQCLFIIVWRTYSRSTKKAHFHLTPLFLTTFLFMEAHFALICKYVMHETVNVILDARKGQMFISIGYTDNHHSNLFFFCIIRNNLTYNND